MNHHLSSITTCSITSLNTNSTVQTLASNATQIHPPRRKKLVAQSRVSKQRINKELVAAGGSQSQVSLQLQLQLQKSTANFHQSPPAGSVQPPPPKPASSPLPKSPIAGSTAMNRPEVKSIWKNSNSGSDTASSQVPASPQHNHAKRPVTASDVVVQAQSPAPAGLQQIPVPSSAQKQQPVTAPTKKLAQQPCSKQQQNADKQQQQTSPTPNNNNQLQQVNNNSECQHHANNGGMYLLLSVRQHDKKLYDSDLSSFFNFNLV